MRISLTANSFNFVLDGLASGVRMMQVQVKIDNATGVANGAANAMALVGKRSVTVETIRA